MTTRAKLVSNDDTTIELTTYEPDVPQKELAPSETDQDTAQHFERQHKNLWFQRLRLLSTTLISIFVFLSLVRVIGGLILIQILFGRYFLWFPLTVELLLNLSSSFLLQSDYPIKHKIVSLRVIACVYLCVNAVCNIVVIVLLVNALKGLILEPDGTVQEDWKVLWTISWAFVGLTVASCLIQIGIVVSLILRYRMSFTILRYAHQSTYPLCKVAAIGHLILISGSMLLFAVSLGSLLSLLLNVGYCDSADPRCYDFCDPIDTTACSFPFPSSYYLVNDPMTVTGVRVNFGENTLPKLRSGGHILPTFWNQLDGFSTMGPLLFYLNNVTSKGFITPFTIGDYALQNVTTVIVNARTNERVPHWVELDAVDRNFPTVIIQPAVPLDFATRYVVGIRNLVDSEGRVLQPTSGFRKLLQSSPGGDVPRDRWTHFNVNVFPVLQRHGFVKDELQLAWDFVTVSKWASLGVAEKMRDAAHNALEKGEVTYRIHRVMDDICDDNPTRIGRTIWGEVTSPYYLIGIGRGAYLPPPSFRSNESSLNPTGKITTQFLLRIPCTLMKNPHAATLILQYGHGLFGRRTEVNAGYLSEMANRYRWILLASDWYGMSLYDLFTVVRVLLSAPEEFAKIPHTSVQGFVNKAMVLRMISTSIAEDSALIINGTSLIDNQTQVAYYGNSQGGILGGAYLALSTQLTRGVLGVPGTPYALLLSRSIDFKRYRSILELEYYNWRDIRIAITAMQMLWDVGEAAGWLRSMNQIPSVGVPKKDVLLQVALGDAQVTPLGAEIMARAYSAKSVYPQVRPIWGVSESPTPFNGSAIVEWRYTMVPPEPSENTPPPREFDTHECVRRERAAQDQIRDFLETGLVNQYCNGPCERRSCNSAIHPADRHYEITKTLGLFTL